MVWEAPEVHPIGENVQLDEGLLAKLPPNCKVLSVTPSGYSVWVKTLRITVQLENGSIASFFKKGAEGPIGAAMMKGTFEADSALHEMIPSRVPKPVAWGTYVDRPDSHFYLCDMGKSPVGQFGFQVTTHLANIPVDNTWNPSWEAFWAQQMKSLFDIDEQVNGPDETVAEMRTAYFEKLIPRYLRPLESDGKSVTPCLIHSDLWLGNIKYRSATNELCLFDSCAFWGHNEADLAICYNARYKLQECLPQYLAQYREGMSSSKKPETANRSDGPVNSAPNLFEVKELEETGEVEILTFDDDPKVETLTEHSAEPAAKPMIDSTVELVAFEQSNLEVMSLDSPTGVEIEVFEAPKGGSKVKVREINELVEVFDEHTLESVNNDKVEASGQQRAEPASEALTGELDKDGYQRNALYAMKFHVLLSIMYAGKPAFRQIVVDEIKQLLDRMEPKPGSRL
ncbi:Fructosamine kinase-domain-containing protein [Staphylotrichum tortipilum]|uniref:protein-ribulosamine 3-kinase n=1 Tax=Staphylotrichum tortipilum TaxID=2831512 RepID=A0AAN6MF74_9PEZI|nr:Fructosamine kinase-domain-containing protein [Staphylotrichum longicolle]